MPITGPVVPALQLESRSKASLKSIRKARQSWHRTAASATSAACDPPASNLDQSLSAFNEHQELLSFK